ncbi:PadR family transcriptional regulator [candidate division KSB1 bacterium]
MKTLSRREEQILLAILALKNDAYLVSVKKYLSEVMKQNWTVGAIHKPLRILEKAGLVEASLGEATAKRGGRSKKIYILTEKGIVLLEEYRKINETLWSSFPGMELR